MVYAIPTYELRSTPAFGRRRRLPPAAAAMLVNIQSIANSARFEGEYVIYIALIQFLKTLIVKACVSSEY